MKISWFKRNITPEVGTKVAGYRMEDVSFSVWNDLMMTGLFADDGERQVLLVSFDLLCLDVEYIQKFRKLCGEILNIPPESVMLTFTHTHGGPQTNSEPGYPGYLNVSYLEFLEKALCEECRKVRSSGQNLESQIYFYSIPVKENLNRRVVTADNAASFLPHRAEFRSWANGFTDDELGVVMFFPAEESKERFPAYVIANYAAHPLAAHTIGTGGRRISADYPGILRDYVTSETGAECMFVSGACGDMIPRKDETGSEGTREMGIHLGEGVLRALLDASRNPERFRMNAPKVGALCRRLQVPLRPLYRDNKEILPERDWGKTQVELEIQCLSIGDVCFTGVPGEWCAELGAEVKWHSAFRKAFIAFGATAYRDYMCPGNFLLQGGYEAYKQNFPARYSIAMVKTAVDALYELKDQLCGPEEDPQTKINQFSLKITPAGSGRN